MKARDKVLSALAVILIIIATAIIAALQGVSHWQANIPPLTVDELKALRVTVDAEPEIGMPDSQIATHTPVAAPEHLRFESSPTENQLVQRFCPNGADNEFWSSPAQVIRRTSATALYRIVPFGRVQLVPANVGLLAKAHGDFDTARSYLREAARSHHVESLRRFICGELAWLETDPDVAAALIEESLSLLADERVESRGAAYAALNAIELALITESDTLAEHYYERFQEHLPAYLETRGDAFPNAAAWVRRRLPTTP